MEELPGPIVDAQLTPPVRISVNRLLPAADSPRLTTEDEEHCRILAGTETCLPPILVHRDTMRVVDGMHRLMAAQIRGDTSIEVRYFDGNAEDAFIMAVRANISHGKPLTLAERERSAERILRSHGERSDRAIAHVCGLSAKTVGAIRRRATGQDPQLDARIGRDGRRRPLDTAKAREQAAEMMRENPEASLREIARATGISPGTVRDVRERIRRRGPMLSTRRSLGCATDTGSASSREGPDELAQDAALLSTEEGRAVVEWLDRHTITSDDWSRHVANVPISRVYVVIDTARSCAKAWAELADALEVRLRRRG